MIKIERDHAERLVALLLGCKTPENFLDPELQVLIANMFTQYDRTHRFSMRINGRDLRATLVNDLVTQYDAIGANNLTDPATFADEIMVNLGFSTGYDENGDYVPGYREYAVDVGLISEPESIKDIFEAWESGNQPDPDPNQEENA